MSVKNIILDCDPGQDDALAILLALGSKNINLKAISVVGGNVTVDRCYTNALKVLALANRLDIPVFKGALTPLKQKLITLESVFGQSGMAGSENWEIPNIPEHSQNAVDFLCNSFMPPSDLCLCATGPQTNIALALQRKPFIAQNIQTFTMMGGCVFPEPLRGRLGNISFDNGKNYAEYNVAMDPDAVDIVFNSDIKKVNLIGLDITRKVLYNAQVEHHFKQLKNKVALAAADMLSTIGEDDIQDYAKLKKTPSDPVRAIHDAVAICYLEAPEIFKTQMLPLRIDLTEKRGQTIIDDKKGRPVNVITEVKRDDFFDVLLMSLKNL